MTKIKTNTYQSGSMLTWVDILRMALSHKKDFTIANVISVISTLLYLPIPLIIPSLINEVLLKQPGFFTTLLTYFLPKNLITSALILITAFSLVLVMRLLHEILVILQRSKFKAISKDVILSIRIKLLNHLNLISMKEYETLGAGKLATFYIKDLDTIDEFIGTSVSQFVVAILALIGVITVLFVINWKIALFILLFNPVSLLLTAKFSKKLKELKTHQNKAFEVFQEAFIETIDTIMQIRADNKESSFIQKLILKAQKVKSDSIAYEWKTEMVSDFSGMLLFIGVDLYYIFGMTLILLNDFSIGMMIALLQYVFQVQWYMSLLATIQSKFYAASAALIRINEAMQLETEPQYPMKQNPFSRNEAISIHIKHLDFAYSNGKPVLKNVSMYLDANKRIGIVGPSGVGKSSLVQSILGFYPFNAGDITINEVPVQDIGFNLIRQNICTVLQQPTVFNDTIRNNIAIDKIVSDEEIWHALELAQLKSTVESFDNKLNSLVGKNGVRLSGGERQRLAIARMLLRDSKVVILDEATSALDLETERKLFESIKSFLDARTTLMITHRLSTVRDADIIYVLSNTKISEQGTHQELLDLKGIYYSLHTLQTK